MVFLKDAQQTAAILAMMIVVGTLRSVAIKMYYQLGFHDPLFLTVLALFSQALALPLFYVVRWLLPVVSESAHEDEIKVSAKNKQPDSDLEECSETESFVDFDEIQDPITASESSHEADQKVCSSNDMHCLSLTKVEEDCDNQDTESDVSTSDADIELPVCTSCFEQGIPCNQENPLQGKEDPLNLRASFVRTAACRSLRQLLEKDVIGVMITETKWTPMLLEEYSSAFVVTPENITSSRSLHCDSNKSHATRSVQHRDKEKSGARESQEVLHWVNRIPKYARPLLGSFLRLLDTSFNMLVFLFLPASLSELSTRGAELIVSFLVQKYIRQRTIKPRRWTGASIVSIGLAIVLCSEVFGGNKSMSENTNISLGFVAVTAKAISGVSSDMVGEIFMKETAYPPSLLLGTQGLYGLIMALPLYYAIGPLLGYQPAEAIQPAFASIGTACFLAFLVVFILMFWLSLLIVVARTSVVTKNIVSGIRGLVVWLCALVIFYASGQGGFGEEWSLPRSPILLVGFIVLMGGVYVYSVKIDIPQIISKVKVAVNVPSSLPQPKTSRGSLSADLQ